MEPSSESPETPNIDYRCPQCGEIFLRYQARCPACGASIDEVFSGQYHPRRGRTTRMFAWLVVVMFLASVAAAVLLAVRSLWQR